MEDKRDSTDEHTKNKKKDTLLTIAKYLEKVNF